MKSFKAPDGKEFTDRKEYREYIILNFYSFKNKKNEKYLIKLPASIKGQNFSIDNCEDCVMAVMDYCEQVPIDNVKRSRIFIGACTSSIFIRDCEDCVFYTCCRQLRLRGIKNSILYVYSMAEVHIEESNGLQFAPFNGGYPEHAEHLKAAKLNVEHNLWYDIYDHSDPNKTHVNWFLLPMNLYEAPWFPAGVCEPAIPLTLPGSVQREDGIDNGNSMQSFSVQQMMLDAQKLKEAENVKLTTTIQQVEILSTPPLPPVASSTSIIPPSPPVEPTIITSSSEILELIPSTTALESSVLPTQDAVASSLEK